MEHLLKSFQKKLTNLSGSNKSLFVGKTTSYDIDVHAFDFLEKLSSFHVIEKLIARKATSIRLCSVLDSRDKHANEISRQLKKIQRRDNFLFQERGATDLYVGWPFIQGKFQDDSVVRCPLLFFPVQLSKNEKYWSLALRKNVPITFNKSFLLAYAHFNFIKIDEQLFETSIEDLDKDFMRFRVELYQLLKDSSLEINFNQELLQDKLLPFSSQKKPDLDKEERTGVLKLYPQAVLGFFPQAGSYQSSDYERIISNNSYDAIEQLFAAKSPFLKTREQFPLYHTADEKSIKEEQLLSLFPTDASQERVTRLVKQGKSLVVEGPPGTGKSQLICNLISDFLSKGKKVLVVCQKRAALDVVYERLSQRDFSSFISLVHDFKNDRKQIYEKLYHQIEKVQEYKFRNTDLDTIYLERNFLKESRKIDEIVDQLDEFKAALFDTKEVGISIKELYLSSDPSQDFISLNDCYRYFTKDKIVDFQSKLTFLWEYTQLFENENYLLKDRKSLAGKGVQYKKQVIDSLLDVFETDLQFRTDTKAILADEINIEQGIQFYAFAETIDQLSKLLSSERVYRYYQAILDKRIDEEWLFTKEKVVMDLYREGVDLSIRTIDLGYFHEVFDKYLKARKNVFQKIKWQLFGKDKAIVKKAMQANKLRWANAGFKIMEKRLNNRLNLEHIVTEFEECHWLKEVPTNLELEQFNKWFNAWHVAAEAKKGADQLREMAIYLKLKNCTYEDFIIRVQKLLSLCEQLEDKHKHWLQTFTKPQLRKILSGSFTAESYVNTLNKDYDALCQYDQMVYNFSAEEREVQLKLFQQRGELSLQEVLAVFNNSISLAWIDHLEIKHPILRIPSTTSLELLETELGNALDEKKKLSKDILLLKLREKTYKNVVYNRLHNIVTYRELKHQVSKKRKVWSLRKLIDHYIDEILDLVPCWLMSPESVSATFPLQSDFDLVIFDEASQCYVEKGFPALYRGKQIVITGDSKQLKPNDLYANRWEDEEEEQAAFQVDSLLDFASLYLEKLQLEGHYRSNALELIDFSNQHFYQGNLQMLPYKEHINNSEPAINYHKVEGLWEAGVNKQEAQKVVQLVASLIASGKESIGVVTFNAKQQGLIQDLLEKHAAEQSYVLPSLLFIKNIENVQGDEREIIIFSIAYAPDQKGKVNTQFGSLNAIGGENRLNVAITRAKEKVIVVTSILPHQLNVENAKNQGPKLFKAYLNYALEVSKGNFNPQLNTKTNFSPAWYLKSQIENHSVLKAYEYAVIDDFPFSDLLLRKNKQFFNIISTDDHLYYKALSTKHSHGTERKMLKKRGWNNERLYSRNYWNNKQKIEEKLLRIVGEE